jgi:hypothetical protein
LPIWLPPSSALQLVPGVGAGGPESTVASFGASFGASLTDWSLPESLEPLLLLELELEDDVMPDEDELEDDPVPESSPPLPPPPSPPSALQPAASCEMATLATAMTTKPVFHVRMSEPLHQRADRRE